MVKPIFDSFGRPTGAGQLSPFQDQKKPSVSVPGGTQGQQAAQPQAGPPQAPTASSPTDPTFMAWRKGSGEPKRALGDPHAGDPMMGSGPLADAIAGGGMGDPSVPMADGPAWDDHKPYVTQGSPVSVAPNAGAASTPDPLMSAILPQPASQKGMTVPPAGPPTSVPSAPVIGERTADTVLIEAPNGQRMEVPKAQAQILLDKGGKLVERTPPQSSGGLVRPGGMDDTDWNALSGVPHTQSSSASADDPNFKPGGQGYAEWFAAQVDQNGTPLVSPDGSPNSQSTGISAVEAAQQAQSPEAKRYAELYGLPPVGPFDAMAFYHHLHPETATAGNSGPMHLAGFDDAKLNDPSHVGSGKYSPAVKFFASQIQNLPPTTESLQTVVASAQKNGFPNAKLVGSDRIDFGDGNGPIDTITDAGGPGAGWWFQNGPDRFGTPDAPNAGGYDPNAHSGPGGTLAANPQMDSLIQAIIGKVNTNSPFSNPLSAPTSDSSNPQSQQAILAALLQSLQGSSNAPAQRPGGGH